MEQTLQRPDSVHQQSPRQTMRLQPWIHSFWFDGLFFLGPAFLPVLAVFLFQLYAQSAISPMQWFFLVVGVDVAHVHSTLYRTYFDPDERKRRGTLLFLIPLFSWLGGALLHSLGSAYFWTVLAYFAVFHFIRQQYGFMMMYSSKGNFAPAPTAPDTKLIDLAAIYAITIYPIVFWHSHLPRSFSWMIEGDFLVGLPGWVEVVARVVLGVVILAYLWQELRFFLVARWLNIPKNLWLLGTGLVWFSGIVFFDSDVSFTLTNVVAHGIPYLALVWLFGARKWRDLSASRSSLHISKIFRLRYIPIFLGFLFLVAYFEEGFWDAYVWRDYANFFPWLKDIDVVTDPDILNWFVPLLAVPQLTHYILDGFIWKIRNNDLAHLDISGNTVRI